MNQQTSQGTDDQTGDQGVASVKHAQPKYDQSLLADPTDPATNTGDPDPDPNPDPDPSSDPAPDPNPNVNDEIDPAVREKIMQELREGVPEAADGYKLPEIEGFDHEFAETTPTIKVMREAAFEAGMKPEQFEKAIRNYVEASAAETKEFHEAQLALLGKDEASRTARVSQINADLTRMLPPEQRDALMGAAISADVVMAIETLLKQRPVSTPQTPPEPQDDWATINKLMNSKEYMGYEHERDPAIVARVERYFERGGKRGG